MPDFTVMLLMERIPGAVIRRVPIGGIEQKCLCIPWDNNVFTLTKKGEHGLQITLREKDRFDGGETHTVYFSYPDPSMVRRETKSAPKCGRCFLSKPIEMNKDTTNTSTYAARGVICIDDIPDEAIYLQPSTGKRFARVMCYPLPKLDRGLNTTAVAIDPEYGADGGRRASLNNGFDAPLVEIGRMRQSESGYKPTAEGPESAAASIEAGDALSSSEGGQGSSPRTYDGYIF